MKQQEFWQITPVQVAHESTHKKVQQQAGRSTGCLKKVLIALAVLFIGFIILLRWVFLLPDRVFETVSPAKVGSAIIGVKGGFDGDNVDLYIRDYQWSGHSIFKIRSIAEEHDCLPHEVVWSRDGYIVAFGCSATPHGGTDEQGRPSSKITLISAYDFQNHSALPKSSIEWASSSSIEELLKSHGGAGQTTNANHLYESQPVEVSQRQPRAQWRIPYPWESY